MSAKNKSFKKRFHKREKGFTHAPIRQRRTVRGFTFVEVMAVTAIISIMTGVALVSASNIRTSKALEIAGQEVAAAIREAQNCALTGKGAEAGCNDYTFTYAAGNSYGISNGAACSVNINYTLKNEVVFQAPGSFKFSVPHGAISGLSGDPEAIILTKSGKQISVCVYDSGRIEKTVIGESCPLSI